MTLALYGKSRRRQGGLLSLGLLAVLVAMLAGVATYTAAFAHALNKTQDNPTCESPGWSVVVKTDNWTGYREVEFTGDAGSVPYSPYILKGNNVTLVNIGNPSNTGSVTSAGSVKMYDGSFGNSHEPGIGPSYNSPLLAGATSISSFFDWPSGYQANRVIKWDNELMLITARSANGKTLTVQRGFAGTSDVQHNDDSGDDVTLWTRNANPSDTESWNINFDASTCGSSVAGTCADYNLAMVDKLQWNGSSYVLDDTGSVAGQQVTITNGTASGGNWNSTVAIGLVIVKGGSGANSVKTYPFPAPPFFPAGTMSGSFDNTGLLNPGGQVPAVSHVEFCAGTEAPKGNIVVKKVKDPTAGVPAADGSQFSGSIDGTTPWGPITFGGSSGLISNISAGNHTVAETGTQNAWTPVGYKVYTNSTEQAACSETKSDYDDDNTAVPVAANETTLVCVMNTKTAAVPSVEKVKATEGMTGGFAYWDIKVNNSENIAQSVRIDDTNVVFVSASGGDCTADSDFADGSITCSVNANSTLVVKVKRELPVAQCTDQYINNTATVYLIPPTGGDPVSIGSAGGTENTKYTIAGDPNACDKPGITKVANTTSTSDPAAVKWTVTVTNPAVGSTGPGGSQTVQIKDENVNVVSGPSYGGSANCTIPGGSSFEAQLTSTNGVQCSMPNNSTITFEVKPAGTIAQTCDAQKFNNTAYLYIGSTGGTPLSDAGEEITLQGDPSLCTRTIEVCKVVVDNGDGSTDGGRFAFQLSWNKAVQGGIFVGELLAGPHPMEGDASAICTTFQAPANETVTIIETNGRPGENVQQPGSWNGDDLSYPQNDYDGLGSKDNRADLPPGTNKVTFYNKTLPRTRDLEICKVVVGNGDGYIDGGVFKFNVTGIDAIELVAYEPALDATDGAEGTAVCATVKVALGQVTVTEWMARPPTYGWEGSWNDDDPLYPQNDVYGLGFMKETANVPGDTGKVTFYNKTLPRTREIEIEKHFVETGGYIAGEGDEPEFALYDSNYPNVDFDGACQPALNGAPNHLVWTCTVPWDWDGTVTETPADGWEQVASSGEFACEPPPTAERLIKGLVQSLTQFETEQELRDSWEFCNRPYGTVIVNKLNSSASGPNFTAAISGLPATDILGGSLDSSPTIAQGSPSNQTLVPLGNQTYSVSEVNAGTAETCGSGATDYVTIVQAPADKVLDTPGEIQEWTIVNQPCGVLGQGGLVLAKYRDNNGDGTANGSDAYEPWTIKVTGPGGYDQTFVLTAAQMPFLVGALAPGNYTVSELTQGGWKVIGLRVDNGTLVANASQTTVAVDGGTNVLRGVVFYNQPRVNIEVNKTEISLATPAGAPGNGWSFTLTGCGITPQVKATGVDGKATFTDLPPAVGCSYTVTETVIGGWSAINPVQVTAPATAGQTAVLNFTNIKIEVCTNCFTIVTPTPTPEKPTPTATPTDPSDPTATPTEEPTKEPTDEPGEEPTEDTAGEKTPGPGQTPIAPSTGTGLMGSGPGGMNMLFALVGLLAISLGTTILALGRKSSRR